MTLHSMPHRVLEEEEEEITAGEENKSKSWFSKHQNIENKRITK